MLTIDEAVTRFIALSPEDKARALGKICYEFTIAGRDVGRAGDSRQQRDGLWAVNEIQHKLAAQMLAFMNGRTQRYPDKDFFLILEGLCQQAHMLLYLQGILSKVL